MESSLHVTWTLVFDHREFFWKVKNVFRHLGSFGCCLVCHVAPSGLSFFCFINQSHARCFGWLKVQWDFLKHVAFLCLHCGHWAEAGAQSPGGRGWSGKADLDKGVPGLRGGKERALGTWGKLCVGVERREGVSDRGGAWERIGDLLCLGTKCCGAIQTENENLSTYFLYQWFIVI